MMDGKELGKITSVRFGFYCGRGEDAFGLKLGFGGPSWGVGHEIMMSPGSPEDFLPVEQGEDESTPPIWETAVKRLLRIMAEGKIRDVSKLEGLPVEVTFEGGLVKSWRVLTEVL